MAISFEIDAYGLLNRWPVRILESPWLFNQFEDKRKKTLNTVYFQRHREIVARALHEAFKTVTFYLGFFPKPTYTYNQMIPFYQRQPWLSQKLNVGRRHLVQFGMPVFTPLSDSMIQIGPDFHISDGIKQYVNVSITLPDADTSLSIRELKDKYRFFLQADGITSPYIYRLQLSTQRVHTEEDGEDLKLKMQIPAWELVNPEKIYESYIENNDKKYRHNDVDDPNGYLVTLDKIKPATVSIDDTDAVKVLSRDSMNNGRIKETAVKPVYINGPRGDFMLENNYNLNISNPYAVKVSYLSGYNYMSNGLMESMLEDAIIKIANTNISYSPMPTSIDASNVFNQDRAEIFESEYHIPSEFMNKLGLRRGSVEAWKVLVQYADNVLGKTNWV